VLSKATLPFIRLWLPAIIVLAGLVVIIARGGDETSLEGGGAIIGAGLSVLLLNVLHRIGVSGDAERGEEDEARDFFDVHGYWPGEGPEPPAAAAPDPHSAPHKAPPEHAPHRRR
jgi:hypothetical protein